MTFLMFASTLTHFQALLLKSTLELELVRKVWKRLQIFARYCRRRQQIPVRIQRVWSTDSYRSLRRSWQGPDRASSLLGLFQLFQDVLKLCTISWFGFPAFAHYLAHIERTISWRDEHDALHDQLQYLQFVFLVICFLFVRYEFLITSSLLWP